MSLAGNVEQTKEKMKKKDRERKREPAVLKINPWYSSYGEGGRWDGHKPQELKVAGPLGANQC